MGRIDGNLVIAVALTLCLIGLIAASLSIQDSFFLIFMLVTVAVGAGMLYVFFPGKRLFSIAFANYLAIYACLFAVFVEENFRSTSQWAIHIGFILPVVAFLAGVRLQHTRIEEILHADDAEEDRNLARIVLWLVPVFAIGLISFTLPWFELTIFQANLSFLVSMAAIAAIVGAVSRDVCRFVIETSELFEGFNRRLSQLIAPIFAFFTVYSLIVIVFAGLYRVVDLYGPGEHFRVEGTIRNITFPESIYFSLVTLSTVGYGDIVPLSSLVRGLVLVEIVMGVLFLMFGVSELMSHSREHRRNGKR